MRLSSESLSPIDVSDDGKDMRSGQGREERKARRAV